MTDHSSPFLTSMKRFLGKVPFTRDAVTLYFCMIDSETSLYAKVMITFALIYFLSPLDTIPDFITGLGFTDDATVILTALTLVKTEVKVDFLTALRFTKGR